MPDEPSVMTTTSPAPPSGRGVRTRKRGTSSLARQLERFALPGVWVVLAVFFSLKAPDTFPTTGNVANILGSYSIVLVLAICLLVPLIAGDYDLSVAYNLSMSAMIIAVLNVRHNWPVGWAVLAALAAGAVLGLVNGALVTLLGIDPIIATLGTGTVASGLVQWMSGSAVISGVSDTLVRPVIIDRLFGIPYEFYYALIICTVMWYVLEYTPAGRRMLIVGRSRSVARLSGLPVRRIRWRGFVVAGVLAAFAGVLYAGTLSGADPSSGNNYLLPGFAAAFLGATTIRPGRFNAWGCFIAVYFLGTGIIGLQILGLQSYVQPLFYGGALIVAVAFSQIVRGREALETA
jgi:ribose transport system permease protein